MFIVIIIIIIALVVHCLFVTTDNNTSPQLPLVLKMFNEIRTVEYDDYNHVENGNVFINYTSPLDNHEIGFISYRPHNGQIGLIFITDSNMQRRKLGAQMLLHAVNEMHEVGTKEVWAVTRQDHEFWSNVFYKGFKFRNPAHGSVTGSGYVMNIEELLKIS